jgi:hypothetical protein
MKKRHKHHHDWGGKKDDRMKYETGHPMNFVMGGENYANAPLWKLCEVCGIEFMGEDSLAEHVKARHG